MKRLLLIIFALFVSFIIVNPALAQEKAPIKSSGCLYSQPGADGVKKVATLECVVPLFSTIVYWLIVFSGVVAVFFIIFGGIKYLTSGGDPGKIDSGKKTLTFAIIGLVVIISSFMIVNIVADLTGVNCISRFGFDSCTETCGVDGKYGTCLPGRTCIGQPPQFRCVDN